MKKKYNMGLAVGVCVCLFVSCEQYAIFGAIAQEVKPKPALIKGSPSKIVKDNSDKLYVANGELWKFLILSGSWAKISAPANTRDVAAVGTDIYVVAVGDSPSLSKLDGGTITAPGTVQGVFGANTMLYVAVGSADSYSVYRYDSSGFSTSAVASGLLHGAAHYNGNYYLATTDGLFYSTDGKTFSSIQSGNFLGVIAENGTAIAVTADAVYGVSAGVATPKVSGDALTGALALSDKTLYLGRTRGYREINTDTSWEFKTPSLSSYTSTIAQVRVTSLAVVSKDLIFASVLSSETKRCGLMSLRNGAWNMEE
jgi:hypothetical protein